MRNNEKTKHEKDLIIMQECLKMLKLTKGKPALYEATKKFVKEKLNSNDLYKKVMDKMAKEN